MANNKAAEFLDKVLSDEELRARLADKAPAQAAELAAELGYEVTEEELIAAEKELRRQNKQDNAEVFELDLDDMDKAAGGSRDWATQGCAATVEAGSTCWSNDYCVLLDVTYTHAPLNIKCPSCGNTMYYDRTTTYYGDSVKYYKCPKCGTETTQTSHIASH